MDIFGIYFFLHSQRIGILKLIYVSIQPIIDIHKHIVCRMYSVDWLVHLFHEVSLSFNLSVDLCIFAVTLSYNKIANEIECFVMAYIQGNRLFVAKLSCERRSRTKEKSIQSAFCLWSMQFQLLVSVGHFFFFKSLPKSEQGADDDAGGKIYSAFDFIFEAFLNLFSRHTHISSCCEEQKRAKDMAKNRKDLTCCNSNSYHSTHHTNRQAKAFSVIQWKFEI